MVLRALARLLAASALESVGTLSCRNCWRKKVRRTVLLGVAAGLKAIIFATYGEVPKTAAFMDQEVEMYCGRGLNLIRK
jgi:hypothetical protein